MTDQNVYEILTIGIQEGKITDDFPKQLIQIFKPQFLEETRYLTMTVDGQGCPFFYDFLTDKLSSRKQILISDFTIEQVLGIRVSIVCSYSECIYEVANKIANMFDYELFYNNRRSDRLRFCLDFFFPYFSHDELFSCDYSQDNLICDNLQENITSKYTIFINQISCNNFDELTAFIGNKKYFVTIKDKNDIIIPVEYLSNEELNEINIKYSNIYHFSQVMYIVKNTVYKFLHEYRKIIKLNILEETNLTIDIIYSVIADYL